MRTSPTPFTWETNVLDLVGRGPVGKSLRYLLRQIERAGVEPEDEDLSRRE